MTSAPQEAIAKIRRIVGDPHCLTDEESLRQHARCTSPWQRIPLAVVYPATGDEVQAVVKVADQYRLPLWPFSQGKNWGYGTTMGYQDGALILILERLNRILEVNQELAFAVIEPGVTQKQLNDYLRRNNIKLWTDCTDSTPQGSVIGNALERGLGYTPYGDHFGHLCGLEVVLPTGEIVRTGGGPENARSWHTYKWGTGPYLDGLFSQANMGIVVKSGVWLMPEPEAFNSFIFEMDDKQHLPAVVDALRRLALHRILQSNVHLVNDMLFLAQIMPYPYELRGDGNYLPDEVRARLRQKYDVAPWSLTGGLYGTVAEVRLQRKALKRALSPYGRVTFLSDQRVKILEKLVAILQERPNPLIVVLAHLVKNLVTRSPVEKLELIPHVHPILKGIPGERIVKFAYFKSRNGAPSADVDPARDEAGMMWLAVVAPLTGRHAQELVQLCQPTFKQYGFEFSVSFIMVNPRSFLALMEIFYDRDNPEEVQRGLDLRAELARLTVAAGYQQYRTTVAFSDRILAPAPEFQELADTLKTTVDPHNILAPGRYGIGLSGR